MRGAISWEDRIEDVPDLDIRRNMMHPEEGLNVVPTGRPRQILLEGQKGGTLGEEDREGRTGGIEQGILAIVAGLPAVRKSPEGRCNLGDKALGLAGNGIRIGVRNSEGLHAQRMPENTRCVQCF